MSHALASYINADHLPKEAQKRLEGRAVDIGMDEQTDPAIVELYALFQSVELLSGPVASKMSDNESIDNTEWVDKDNRRTSRDLAHDEMPACNPEVQRAILNLLTIDHTTHRMRDLLQGGAKNAEKLRIASALPTVFTKDNDAYLQQLQQGFSEWAKKLDAYAEKYGKYFDDEQAQYVEAASKLAHHAAKRCAEIEIGPKLAVAAR